MIYHEAMVLAEITGDKSFAGPDCATSAGRFL